MRDYAGLLEWLILHDRRRKTLALQQPVTPKPWAWKLEEPLSNLCHTPSRRTRGIRFIGCRVKRPANTTRFHAPWICRCYLILQQWMICQSICAWDPTTLRLHVSLSPIYISSLTVMEGTFKSETLSQGEAKPMQVAFQSPLIRLTEMRENIYSVLI